MSKPTDGASIYIAEIAKLTLQNESLTRENASLQTLHHPQTRLQHVIDAIRNILTFAD